MESQTTAKFWKAFYALPPEIQEAAKKAYDLWLEDPFNQSLKFKQIHPKKQIYSVRIGLNWRALGVKENNTVIWFWIGSHADYDRLISAL